MVKKMRHLVDLVLKKKGREKVSHVVNEAKPLAYVAQATSHTQDI